VSGADFDAWVAKARGSGAALDEAAYARLAAARATTPPTTYRAVAPQLFDHIVEQTAVAPDQAHADMAHAGG
jgi:cytochrome o ubiquinol oxidase subunit 2